MLYESILYYIIRYVKLKNKIRNTYQVRAFLIYLQVSKKRKNFIKRYKKMEKCVTLHIIDLDRVTAVYYYMNIRTESTGMAGFQK